MPPFIVCALYHFTRLDDLPALRERLLNIMNVHDVRGTLLLAPEGINGTIAADREGIDAVLAVIRAEKGLAEIVVKESTATDMPFRRRKVRLKKEIVTMGVEGLDPEHEAGIYVKPQEWNQLIHDPDVLIIDTRNDYEVRIGTFEGAINPQTDSFRAFPDYAKRELMGAKEKKIAMFCTGGIRCEKATAYLKSQGFGQVYHLEGGILKYLEEIPEEDSLWRGECFVFDERVAVGHRLEESAHGRCHGCRMPLSPEEMEHPDYEEGVSCSHCRPKRSEMQRQRYAERHTQMRRAESRGLAHLGNEADITAQKQRTKKHSHKEAQRQYE